MERRFSAGDFNRLRSRLAFFASPRIAPAVRSCTILGGRNNSAVYVTEILDALPKFINLRLLALQYVRMSFLAVAGIRRATVDNRLSLSLVSCMTDFLPSIPGTIQLDKFALHNDHIAQFPHDNRWLTVLNLRVLRVLNLARPHSTTSFIVALGGIQLPALEVLELHVKGLDAVTEEEFISSLSSFPTLRTLSLHPPLWPNPYTQSSAYCTGRRIVHLKLYVSVNHMACDRSELIVQLPAIGCQSPALASLELRAACPTTELSKTIAATFVELKSLRIVVPYYGASAIPVPDFHGIVNSIEALFLPSRLEILYLAFRHRIDIREWALPLSKNEKTEIVIRELGERYPTLRQISLCCSLTYTNELQGTTVWRWTRDKADQRGGTITSRRSIECEYIDIREPTLYTNSVVTNAAADTLEDEWLDATREHRGLFANSL
ncbi:hypothetical protein C8R44DRAFT_895366 [Mycena epipterygia]|nr:hypothetical protein C8R44DRAFT_895366 [Mycena epipterygia]